MSHSYCYHNDKRHNDRCKRSKMKTCKIRKKIVVCGDAKFKKKVSICGDTKLNEKLYVCGDGKFKKNIIVCEDIILGGEIKPKGWKGWWKCQSIDVYLLMTNTSTQDEGSYIYFDEADPSYVLVYTGIPQSPTTTQNYGYQIDSDGVGEGDSGPFKVPLVKISDNIFNIPYGDNFNVQLILGKDKDNIFVGVENKVDVIFGPYGGVFKRIDPNYIPLITEIQPFGPKDFTDQNWNDPVVMFDFYANYYLYKSPQKQISHDRYIGFPAASALKENYKLHT